MSRLSSVLGTDERQLLSRVLCTRAATEASEAGLRTIVVSSSHAVAEWAADLGLDVLPDPGGGLTSAVASAVTTLEGLPWIALHADLPLVTASALRNVADLADNGTVLVPSHDGGTNVIASTGTFAFAYGPGSFHRHFVEAPDATIVSNAELSIDIDTETQLSAFPDLLNGRSVST